LAFIKADSWTLAGTNSGQRHQGLRAQAMSSTTNGNSISSMGNSRNDPDHLLVLVHGILARYFYSYIKKIISCSNCCAELWVKTERWD